MLDSNMSCCIRRFVSQSCTYEYDLKNQLILELFLLGSLRAVLGAGLFAVRNACGIQSSADDVVTGTGQVLDSSASDQDNAVLLKVVSLSRNVAGDLDSVGKTDSCDLTKCGVRLLRGRSLNSSANAALLRAVVRDRLLMKRVKAS